MTDVAGTAPERAPEHRAAVDSWRLIAATEIDLRLFGMLVALGRHLVGFDIADRGQVPPAART